jgi:hypothetical protein
MFTCYFIILLEYVHGVNPPHNISASDLIILLAAALLDKQIDPVNGLPKLEAVIPPPYNTRITGMLPPWVSSPEITLRKPPRIIFPLEDYVEKKRLSSGGYDLVCQSIRERKNGTTWGRCLGWKRYRVLNGTIPVVVLPLIPEFIRNEDGKEKQDCEQNAAKRWIERHKERYTALKLTILGDEFSFDLQGGKSSVDSRTGEVWRT